jgi:hypothetical protein
VGLARTTVRVLLSLLINGRGWLDLSQHWYSEREKVPHCIGGSTRDLLMLHTPPSIKRLSCWNLCCYIKQQTSQGFSWGCGSKRSLDGNE